MGRFISALVVALVAAFTLPFAAAGQEFSTKAKFAVLMDYESGSVLFNKAAEERLEPASMAKLMTVAVVFNQLRNGRVKMDDEYVISEHAWREGGAASGGSTMFAELNSRVRVEDLLKSVIIQSGNDAAIALAEGVAGTEETFARLMNQLAAHIGLRNSNFTNATGLPDPDQYSTAHDLAVLAKHLIQTYPEYYSIFSEPEFTWNKIRQENRNSLVEMGIGVDGLKTGHTEASGYGSVISTMATGRRLIAVVHGLTSMAERREEARKLVTWGTRGFDILPLFGEGETVGYADVFGGEQPQVPLIGQGDVAVLVPKATGDCLETSIVYQGPLRPPVEQGAQVARLEVMCNGKLVQQTPLYAAARVGEGDLVRKSMDALKHLAIGWM